MDELAGGIRRVTTPLPTRPGHVHAYLLPGEDGWTLVDTGLGLPDAKERWQAELAGLDGPVTRIVVTHFHPDHVGAARILAELTGAEVIQGEVDYAQCRLVWGNPEWAPELATWFVEHGVPPEVTDELLQQGSSYAQFIQYQPDPTLVNEGDRMDGWELMAAPATPTASSCSGRTASSSRPTTCSAASPRPSASGRRAGPIRSATI